MFKLLLKIKEQSAPNRDKLTGNDYIGHRDGELKNKPNDKQDPNEPNYYSVFKFVPFPSSPNQTDSLKSKNHFCIPTMSKS
jgi:hypothetical protein